MLRSRHTLGLATAAAFLLPAAAQAGPPQLHGNVAPHAVITLGHAGHLVESLPAGTYRLVVEDRGGAGNIFRSDAGFHLAGPGMDLDVTSPAFVGVCAMMIELRPGHYRY